MVVLPAVVAWPWATSGPTPNPLIPAIPGIPTTATPATPATVVTVMTPAPAPTPGGTLNLPCWQDPANVDSLCRRVYDWTSNRWLAESSDWVIAKPAAALGILFAAWLVRVIAHRFINRLTQRVVTGTAPRRWQRGRATRLRADTALLSARRQQRTHTMASVLRNVTTITVYTIAALLILSTFGVTVGPLLASAGILGVALGFGSQALVRDFLSGIFMILEDQYGVGDVIDAGVASGSVESVGLRVTRLRDVSGTVWYIPNGTIARVGNMSQGWARAVIDVGVAYREDPRAVIDLLTLVAHDLAADPKWHDLITEEPEVWGVENLGPDGMVIRVVVTTAPLQQWAVGRELRARIKAALDEHGIEIPFPQRTVWVRTPSAPESEEARADAHLQIGDAPGTS